MTACPNYNVRRCDYAMSAQRRFETSLNVSNAQLAVIAGRSDERVNSTRTGLSPLVLGASR
jgi:hypothetical protein